MCVRYPHNTWLSHFLHSSSFSGTFLWHWNSLLMIILAPNVFLYSLKWTYFRNSLKSSLPKLTDAVVIVGCRSVEFLHFPVYQLILAKNDLLLFPLLVKWNSIIKALFLWDNAREDTVQGLACCTRCQINTRKGAANNSQGCLAVACHCTQHCQISKRSAYYSLDCAQIQRLAFLCAEQIAITSSSINKASEGIVWWKKRERTCPPPPPPRPTPHPEASHSSHCLMFAPCCHSQHIS